MRLLLLLLLTCFAYSQESSFADKLMLEEDYFRAISEYKKLEFYSKNQLIRDYCNFNIGKAYYLSGKYKSSIQIFARMLNKDSLVYSNKSDLNIYLGLNYLGLKVYPLADNFLTQAVLNDSCSRALFFRAFLYTESGNYNLAILDYDKIKQTGSKSKYQPAAISFAQETSRIMSAPQKSAVLAGLFSAIIPGSGQVYSKHYYDGIQAFLYVGAFSAATYLAYKYDSDKSNGYSNTIIGLSLTGFFHSANILGAAKTAEYFNFKQKEESVNQLRQKIYSDKLLP